MNLQLRRMIAEPDRNKRAQLAGIVQADIECVSRRYLELAERHEKLVRALLAAGVTIIPDTDEALSLVGIEDEGRVEAQELRGKVKS